MRLLPGRARASRIRMVPDDLIVDGRTWHYAVSDNDPAEGWALNVHGFFSGAGVHYRESARLAADLGVRVVNPSVPGFAGSDPLPWARLSFSGIAEGLAALLDHLGAPAALLLGHSMGGAIAMQLAHDHPDRVLGVICRNGVAADGWKHRHGVVAKLAAPVSPDLGNILDLLTGLAIEVPQLALSRWRSLGATAAPDIRLNVRTGASTMPIAAMLLGSELSPITAEVGRRGDVPVLPIWGRWDQLVPLSTGRQVAELVGEELYVVPGGHCWMLIDPRTQVAMLRTRAGTAFLDRVAQRANRIGAPFPLAA